jgi:spermidine/putrescine transport system ATP-binding protein
VQARGPGAATVVVEGGSTVRVPPERLDGNGAAVKVGVRPEKIRLERDQGEAPADWNSVGGLLRMASFVGVSHQYTVEGPGGKELTIYAQNDGAETAPHPGERVRLLWRPEHTFVVEAEGMDTKAPGDKAREELTQGAKP